MNRKTTRIVPWLLTVFILLLGACKSSRQAEGPTGKERMQETRLLESIIRQNPSLPSFSAKMRLTTKLGGKEISVNGTLKMQRDGLIRLSLSPLLGIEVARIEISRDNVLVLDRINRQYICIPLAKLTFLLNGELNFHTLQALFGHHLFLPGTEMVTTEHSNDFRIDSHNGCHTVSPRKKNRISYAYTTDADGQITLTQIEAFGRYTLQWLYGRFTPMGNTSFPAEMTIRAYSDNKQLEGQLELSKMESGKTTLTPTDIPQRYHKLEADQLFKLLMNL